MQFPCNVFDLSAARGLGKINTGPAVLLANHPFGGFSRVQACRTILRRLAQDPAIDRVLRDKLGSVDDLTLADAIFACIMSDTGIHFVIPAMMDPDHVRTNVRAISESRFTAEEVENIRSLLTAGNPAQSIEV
jgi:hypothetical protein